jgi:DNA-binding NarL/FixJ family response regulator
MCRILIANQPRVLRDILRRALERQPPLSVVGAVSDLERLPREIEQAEANWVIVSLEADGALPASVEPLLSAYPLVGFMGVARDGSQFKVQASGHEAYFDNPNLEDLVAALRHEASQGNGANSNSK